MLVPNSRSRGRRFLFSYLPELSLPHFSGAGFGSPVPFEARHAGLMHLERVAQDCGRQARIGGGDGSARCQAELQSLLPGSTVVNFLRLYEPSEGATSRLGCRSVRPGSTGRSPKRSTISSSSANGSPENSGSSQKWSASLAEPDIARICQMRPALGPRTSTR
jgi:hypothetical protein